MNEIYGEKMCSEVCNTHEAEPAIPHTAEESGCHGEALLGQLLQGLSSADLELATTEAVPQGQGSNWWVVAGKHTATGHPILAGDPHLRVKVPNFWHQASIAVEGGTASMFAGGACCPGFPGVIAGMNDHCCWSVTLGYADVEDVFMEYFRPDGKYLAMMPGVAEEVWVDPEEEWIEKIHVKGEPEPREVKFRRTRNGAVLESLGSDGTSMPNTQRLDVWKEAIAKTPAVAQAAPFADGRQLKLSYSGLPTRNQSFALQGICELTRADSFESFDAALALASRVISLNFCYADIAGNIGYVFTGEVPIRTCARGVELFPLEGWTGEAVWAGHVSHADLPKEFNPARGYIISANHKVVDYATYPHYLGDAFKSGYRAQRIQELLEAEITAGRPITLKYIEQMQLDTVSCAAREFGEEIVKLGQDLLAAADTLPLPEPSWFESTPATPRADVEASLKAFQDWDGDLRANSKTAALYELMHGHLVQFMLKRHAEAANRLKLSEADVLATALSGKGFDLSANLKMVNAHQGHLHLNVLRMLRKGFDAETGSLWLQSNGGDGAGVVVKAIQAAQTDIRNASDKTWGNWHQMDFPHLLSVLGVTSNLDPPSLALGGDTNTINNSTNTAVEDYRANASSVSMRCIFDVRGPIIRGFMAMPLGQSAVPGSAHYSDRTDSWHAGKTLCLCKMPSSVEEIMARPKHYLGEFSADGQSEGRACGC